MSKRAKAKEDKAKNRAERRKDLIDTRVHTKFIYEERSDIPVEFKKNGDGRTTAIVKLEGYASTRVKDGSGDIVEPSGIDLTRFEAGNAPLKSMHGRGVLSNVGVIKTAKVDVKNYGLYIEAEARLDVTKDNQGQPVNKDDYVLYDRLMSGTVNGFSIGFHNIEQEYDEEKEANVITSLTLHEISLVDVPDNMMTVRKMLEMINENKSKASREVSDKGKEGTFNSDNDTGMEKDKNIEKANEEEVETEEDGSKEVNEESVSEEEKVNEEETKEVEENESEEEEEKEESEEKEMDDEDEDDSEEEKELNDEDSMDDMLKEASIELVDSEENDGMYVVAIYQTEYVFNHYRFGDDGFDKYYRNSYSMTDGELSVGDDPTEVESQRIWVDKAKFLRELEGKSSENEVGQESAKEAGNGEADTPENGEDSDEVEESEDEAGDSKTLEIAGKEFNQSKVEFIITNYAKALDTVEAQKDTIAELQQEVEELNNTVKQYKSIKMSNGLTLSEAGKKKNPTTLERAVKQIEEAL